MVVARKITTVVTGVAGSPYYVSGYFLADSGTLAADRLAWHTMVTTGTASRLRVSSVWTTQGTGPEIETTTGEQVGFYSGADLAVTGTSTSEFLPPATQMLLQWRTDTVLAGRRVRGRTFHPLHAEGENTPAGNVEPVALDDMVSRAETLITTSGGRFGVYSKKNGALVGITAVQVNSAWSVLRSRRSS